MGGAIGAALAIRHPSRVERLVLISAAGYALNYHVMPLLIRIRKRAHWQYGCSIHAAAAKPLNIVPAQLLLRCGPHVYARRYRRLLHAPPDAGIRWSCLLCSPAILGRPVSPIALKK